MKFIVNVRLVENRAKSTVGKVMVEKVMIQINIPGSPLAMASKAWPSRPSHDVGGSCGAVVKAEAWAEAVVVAVARSVLSSDEWVDRLARERGCMA